MPRVFVTLPIVWIFYVLGKPTGLGFFSLPFLLFPSLLHLLLLFLEPRGLWRLLVTWSASLLMLFYACFYVAIFMVGGREAFHGGLPGPGALLALAGCLAAMVWEPLRERREWLCAHPKSVESPKTLQGNE